MHSIVCSTTLHYFKLVCTLLFVNVVNTQIKIHLIDLDTLDSKWRGIHLNHPKRERIDLIIELLQW